MHLADDVNKKTTYEQTLFQELCLPSNIPTFCETSWLELKPNSLSWIEQNIFICQGHLKHSDAN